MEANRKAAASGKSVMLEKQNINNFRSSTAGNISTFLAILMPVLKLVGGNELSLETTLKKPTTIMAMFGHQTVDISTEAATYIPSNPPLDIALVLDRTGSMAGANIAGLITASDDFISQLESEGGDTRIAVIPFADYVNIGTDKASEIWLDMPSAGGSGSPVECSMESAGTSSCFSTSSGS